jgi:cobyric acid synthase
LKAPQTAWKAWAFNVKSRDKALTCVKATHLARGEQIEGYEIHLGSSHGPIAPDLCQNCSHDDGATAVD